MPRPLLPLLLVLLLGGCAELIRDPAAPEVAGLALSLGALPAEAAAGDTVEVRIRLTNTNPRAVTLQFATGCQILLYVSGPDGEIVEPRGGGWICAAVLTRLHLRAGEREERTFRWVAERVHFAPGGWEPIREPLPPGEYRVVGVVEAAELDGRRISLRTPEVVVRVR